MKFLSLFILLLFYSCAKQEILMREMPLKLTQVKKGENIYGENLKLTWQSLDGYVSIVTLALRKTAINIKWAPYMPVVS